MLKLGRMSFVGTSMVKVIGWRSFTGMISSRAYKKDGESGGRGRDGKGNLDCLETTYKYLARGIFSRI